MSGMRSLGPAVPPIQGRTLQPAQYGAGAPQSRTVRTVPKVCGASMNASVEALTVAHRAHLAPASAPEMVVREGVMDVPGEVSLYHGGRLSGIRVAWRLAGPANAPVVCALGGISANRRVFDQDNPKQGWWSEVVGPGQALDAEHFRVLSFDYLGGSAETTGPARATLAAVPVAAARALVSVDSSSAAGVDGSPAASDY